MGMRPLVTLAAACIAIPSLAQSGLDDTRKRAKLQRFDATATIPCAQERGEALGTCKAGVARNGSGTATVASTGHLKTAPTPSASTTNAL